MLGIVGGGFAAAEAVAEMPTPPITVADGVVVQPLPGWEFGGRADDGGGVLFSKGDGSLAVSVVPGRPEPAAALSTLLAGWRSERGTVISTSQVEPSTVRAQPAARVAYSGNFAGINYPVEGEVTAVQGSRATVLFDGWAGVGDYARVRADIDRMIVAATIP